MGSVSFFSSLPELFESREDTLERVLEELLELADRKESWLMEQPECSGLWEERDSQSDRCCVVIFFFFFGPLN